MMDKTHPIWKILSNLVILGIILSITSSKFDETEIITLIAMIIGNGATEKILQK